MKTYIGLINGSVGRDMSGLHRVANEVDTSTQQKIVNGSAISVPENVHLVMSGIENALRNTFGGIVGWISNNWKLALLAVLGIVLIFRKL